MRKKTLYEPDFSSNIDVEDLVNWGRGIQLALGVVDEFKLNTRIWSKG
jgi:anti-sigma regulatory factor (Ser/Thr protein kinase)